MINKPMTNQRMNQYKAALAVTSVLMSAPLVQADSFTGFDMNFVTIGNAGNNNDGASGSTAYGGVVYNYRMAVNEVSQGMVTAYNNATDGGPDISFFDLVSHGGNGVNKVASGVSWNEAARFVNWLNTSQGYQAAYSVSGAANSTISLWASGDAWQVGGENLFRHKDAHYFLPSENEWYKAAYYNPDTGTYFDYATGSDTAPTATSGGTASGTAVYRDGVIPNPVGPADITNAGGLSPYGTMAQNGNVWERCESTRNGANDFATKSRVLRGGAWSGNSSSLQSLFYANSLPDDESYVVGFRVAAVAATAAVPEPSGVSLLLIGAVGLLIRRKRG